MTTAPLAPAARPATVTARRPHRPLLVTTAGMAVLAVFSLCAMLFDDRMLLHESVWLKAFKFAFAFALYTATLSWLLSFPHRGQRLTWWMGTVFAATSVVDVGFITVQAARGTFSHFNDESDAVNVIGQQLFQSGVPGLFLANLVIALVLSWQHVTDRPTTRAIHYGLGIAVVGMALGYLMGFSGEQKVTDAYGKPVTLVAGHTIVEGRPQLRDGVGGMPITHWSTIGGDMRIPHFVGLHGIQVLILAAFLLARFAPRVPLLRDERARADLIRVLALGYAGLLGVLLWQALRAQPLIRPDAATLGALGVVAAVTVAGAVLVRVVRGGATPPASAEISAVAPHPGSASPMSR
ncbi:hypothetical protein [Nocardia jejuensis]|uniref:hypothetical protein n=1 Tax=Nocardia jejuensis TaxID=328049 RepID=UPI000836641F|nr:hypothetical protein [Nocardia jejuensis]